MSQGGSEIEILATELPLVKRILKSPLFRGQFISILIAGTGIFATYLSSYSPTANFPTFMNFLNYLLLSFFMAKRLIWFERFHIKSRPISEITLSNPPLLYAAAAVLDVEANFLVLTAYNYTSITSVMLLDCFTIPCAMLLSTYFLRAKYQLRHYIGICFCLSGLGCIIYIDLGKEDGMSDAVIGDILCLFGAFLYACTNVLQERVVKTQNREEYLGMVGVFGACIALVQSSLLDLEAMKQAPWDPTIVMLIIGFLTCLFLMYINTSLFLETGDCTFFNLSLLTSDVYAVIFAYFFTGKLVHWLYFLGFALVSIGLSIYHSSKKPVSCDLSGTCSVIVDSSFSNAGLDSNAIVYNPLDHNGDNKSEEYFFQG